ncbi:MAG: CinA family nicotinamide mononucleotide deamidase-related protein [Candidatus Methylumidiphilus sp.]
MHAEIITIGSEILLGEIIDTNSAAIAKKLQSIGMPLHYTCTVGDDLERMVAVIRQGLARSDVVVTTGGLGPTVDDLTREAVAQAVGKPLVFDESSLAQIEDRFRRWGRTMTDNNRKQAYRPEGSTAMENPVGTAPCFIVGQDGRVVISLPGVPREMEYLMDHAVLPFLRQRFKLTGTIKSRALKVSGAGEAQVDAQVGDLEKLDNPAVGLNAQSGVVVIRITATAVNEKEADGLIAPVEATVRERLGNLIFGADADTLEGVVLDGLNRRGENLAVIESGTGGRLAGKLSLAGHGRAAFAGGKIIGLAESADLVELARLAAGQAPADWGLACVVDRKDGQIQLGVGLWNDRHSGQWRRGFGGHAALAPEWSSNVALDALRQALSAAEFK